MNRLNTQGPVVAVTGMIASDSPAPGVAVIRSLRAHPEFNGRIIGLAYDAMEAGNFLMDVADDAFLIPYPSQGGEDFLERLLYIQDRCGLDVLIPNLDSELTLVIQMADRLKEHNIATFIPTLEQFKLRAKDHLSEMASSHGLPTPRTKVISDLADLDAAGQDLEYPFLVKGIFYEAYIAHDGSEARTHFDKLRQKWGLPIIAQEFLPGDEYNVAAIGDGKGGLIGAVPMRKLQLTDKGKAWSGVTVEDKALMGLTRKTIHALGWKGPIELEVIKSEGRYYILEINPRFPAWIYLAQGAGQNLPYACLELAQGRKVRPLPPCRPGTVFIRAAMDYIMHVARIEEMIVRESTVPAHREPADSDGSICGLTVTP